jgi:hypothetical protein
MDFEDAFEPVEPGGHESTTAERNFFAECAKLGLPDAPRLFPPVVISMARALSAMLLLGFGQFVQDNPTLAPYYAAALRAIAQTHLDASERVAAEISEQTFGDLPVAFPDGE